MKASKQIQEQRKLFRVENQRHTRNWLAYRTGKPKNAELRQATKEMLRTERQRLADWYNRLRAATRLEAILRRFNPDDREAILALAAITAKCNDNQEANNE